MTLVFKKAFQLLNEAVYKEAAQGKDCFLRVYLDIEAEKEACSLNEHEGMFKQFDEKSQGRLAAAIFARECFQEISEKLFELKSLIGQILRKIVSLNLNIIDDFPSFSSKNYKNLKILKNISCDFFQMTESLKLLLSLNALKSTEHFWNEEQDMGYRKFIFEVAHFLNVVVIVFQEYLPDRKDFYFNKINDLKEKSFYGDYYDIYHSFHKAYFDLNSVYNYSQSFSKKENLTAKNKYFIESFLNHLKDYELSFSEVSNLKKNLQIYSEKYQKDLLLTSENEIAEIVLLLSEEKILEIKNEIRYRDSEFPLSVEFRNKVLAFTQLF